MITYTATPEAVAAIVGAKDAHYELEYFGVLFNSAGTRALLAYSGLKNKQTPYGPDTWPAYKPNTPYECLPILKVTKDEHQLTLSEVVAVDQFLARQAGLLGSNAYEEAVITAHHSNAQALFYGSTMVGYFWPTLSQDDKAKKDGLEKLKGQIESWARMVEGHLANNKHGVLVGDKISLADIKVVATVMAISYVIGPKVVEAIVNKEKTPGLFALEKKLLEKDSYRAWVESEDMETLKKVSKIFSQQFHPEFFAEE
ncbi:hypothetical protein BGZ73_007399 [Actinomortierella ambigua]|nr:hypothetical protein BGZ73_007399 [Actinomortierella ambigua]